MSIEVQRSQSRLDIFIGSMMAGKTSALIRKLTLLAEMGFKPVYINHGNDTRAETVYSTHSALLEDRELAITTIRTTDLSVLPNLDRFDVIGIDEAQFFGAELVEVVKHLVDVKQKYVIVVGLDGNFNREKFGYILDLIPIADNVHKLHAYCKQCALEKKTLVRALFSHYTGDPENSGIDIGGVEKYQALCRDCYLQLIK